MMNDQARVSMGTLGSATSLTCGSRVFMPMRLALTTQGYAALLDGSSIDFQASMAAFMAAPMVALMRIRGCSWRDGAEMTFAMLLPIAGVFALRGVGLSGTLPWLSNSEHSAMLVGMLVLMLYRRERALHERVLVPWLAARGSAAQVVGPRVVGWAVTGFVRVEVAHQGRGPRQAPRRLSGRVRRGTPNVQKLVSDSTAPASAGTPPAIRRY